jgi:hypothetical protein
MRAIEQRGEAAEVVGWLGIGGDGFRDSVERFATSETPTDTHAHGLGQHGAWARTRSNTG